MYAIFDPFEPILLIRERRQLIFPLELEIFFSKNLGETGTGGTRRPYQIRKSRPQKGQKKTSGHLRGAACEKLRFFKKSG